MRRITRLLTLFVVGIAFVAVAGADDTNKADTTSLEGQAAPEVSLNMMGGKKFKLSEEKGNVVLMDYWATWCPPCRQSLPHIQEISQDKDLAAKGLKVFAIDDRESGTDVVKFMKDNNYTFNAPLDRAGEFGKAYLVRGIPTTVVVGRDGVIKKVFIGFGPGREDEIKAAVNKALDDKAAN
jgi:thiol-disulfide isomerase/thioredoxin